MSEEFFETVSDFVRSRSQTVKNQIWRTASEFLDKSLMLRLVLIIGGYMLVRPYIEKVFEWGLRRKMAKEEEERKNKRKTKKQTAETVGVAKTDPNTVRYGHLKGKVDVSDDTDSEDEKLQGRALTTEEQTDQKARRRHRRVLRAKLDEDELRQLEEDEWNDPDIEDLLAPRRD